MLYLHPRLVIIKGKYDELFWMLSSHIVKTAAISHLTGYGIPFSYFLYWCGNWVGGILLFGHFSLSHTFLPTVKENEFPTWVDYALHHTVDISTQNPVVSNIMFFLNNQCSHHLFTRMPQYKQPKVSLELAEFAKKWNRPYHHISYFEAWKRMLTNLDEVGKHYYKESLELLKEE